MGRKSAKVCEQVSPVVNIGVGYSREVEAAGGLAQGLLYVAEKCAAAAAAGEGWGDDPQNTRKPIPLAE